MILTICFVFWIFYTCWVISQSIIGTPHITASGYKGDISDNIEAATYWAAHPKSLSNCVRIPKGEHIVSRTIHIKSPNIVLNGKGSVLQCSPNFKGTCLSIESSDRTYKNLSIYGPFNTGFLFQQKKK